MKIAIGKKELEKYPNLIKLKDNSENDVMIFDEDIFSNEDIKREWINVVITNDFNIIRNIYTSLSVNTSTYVICDNNMLVDAHNQFNVTNLNNVNEVTTVIDKISTNRTPTMEKIWNRYYTDEQLKKEFPKMTKNDFIRSKNIDPNLVALEYFGKKITYGEYDKKIVEYSRKLETLGVKPGDSVALCLPNTIETMLLVAAMDENAIVCNNIFPLESADRIKDCINMMGSKLAFVLDSRYKDLDKVANKTTLTRAYLVNPFESLPAMKKIMRLKGKLEGNDPKESGFDMFSDFIKLKETNFKKAKYESNRLSSIQYTSGTKGMPKATMLTDDTLNARAHQYEQLDVGLKEQMYFLHPIPICGKAYGEFTMHLGLSNALVNVLLPTFESKELLKTIVKYKGQGVSLPPHSYDDVIDDPKFKKTDMSNYRLISLGAEGATKKHIELIENAFRKQGYKNTAILGAGGTELGVTFATNTHQYNDRGTSGFPLIGNNVKIVDENGNELSYNFNGRIIYSSVSPCIGYANKNVELKKDDFGIDLGDYGYIKENGNLVVLGRVADLIEVNGEKIAPAEIEQLVDDCPYVKYVYVVEPKNSDNKFRVCYIPFDNVEVADLDGEVMKYIPEKYKDMSEVYHIVDVPMAPSLKADREALASDISKFIYRQNYKIKIKKHK